MGGWVSGCLWVKNRGSLKTFLEAYLSFARFQAALGLFVEFGGGGFV